MIEVRDLSFSYGSKKVLKDISFDASPGELLCILGHNGAGKSTLFKCMLGLLKADSGSVRINGRNIMEMSAPERAQCVAYIPQAARPVFSYSVMDMVLMGMTSRFSGRMNPRSSDCSEAMKVLEKIGAADFADRDYT